LIGSNVDSSVVGMPIVLFGMFAYEILFLLPGFCSGDLLR
jgi:hypothetical protein